MDNKIDLTTQPGTSNDMEIHNVEMIAQPTAQAETTVVPNSPITTAKQSPPFEWNIGTGLTGQAVLATNSLFNTNFYSAYAVKFDEWQSNFNYMLGPCNPAFVDATLSYQDMADGLHLETNPNGVLWRVNSAGIPTYQDLNNYFEQNRVIEATDNHTVEEIKPSLESVSQAIREEAGKTEPRSEPISNKPLILTRKQQEHINNPFAEILLANGLPLNTRVIKTLSASSNGHWYFYQKGTMAVSLFMMRIKMKYFHVQLHLAESEKRIGPEKMKGRFLSVCTL